MKILVVCSEFPPEPRELNFDIALAFRNAGHDVQVVTGFPNWPFGKLYPGYKQRLVQRETIGGLPTIRLPIYANHDPSGIKRALNILSLPVSLFLLGPFVVRRPDHIYVIQSPFNVIVGRWLAFFWRAKLSMEVQDLWPNFLDSTGTMKSPRLLKLLGSVVKFAYRVSRRIRVRAPGFAAELTKVGVPPDKIHLIPDWIDDEVHKPMLSIDGWEGPRLYGDFSILYAGAIGLPQQLSVVLDAAALLEDRPDIWFYLAGDGVERKDLETQAKDRRLDRVKFLGSFPQRSMAGLFFQADVLFLQLARDPLWDITLPSKLVTYLAYQKPILAGLGGDPKRIIDESACGITYEPGNARELADAARKLADMSQSERDALGLAGRRAAESRFSYRIVARSLAEMVEEVHRPKGVPGKSSSDQHLT